MTDVVRVRVKEVKPSGLSVDIIGDDRKGFIRKKDLSWDRRVWADPDIPEIGDEFEARITKDGKRTLLLSLRELHDPWKQVPGKYKEGQPVWGEVIHVRHFGVFVQLEPGIEAAIWRSEIPLLRNQQPKDVLSIGDQVMGTITKLDLQKQEIAISPLKWLHMLNRLSLDERQAIQRELFRETLQLRQEDEVLQRRSSLKHEKEQRRYHPPVPNPERILVIDDEPQDLEAISSHLKSFFGIPVDSVSSSQEALAKIEGGKSYGVAVVDLDLGDERGGEVAATLALEVPDLAFVFTSNNPRGEDRLPSGYVRRYPFVLKDKVDVAQAVERLLSGYWEEIKPNAEENSFIRQLRMESFAQRSIEEILSRMLITLREEIHAKHAFVLEVNSVQKSASILAADPPLDSNLHEQSVDGLYYSPARNVVEEEDEFYASYVDPQTQPQFKYFFPLLEYRSCFGVPLQIPDIKTRHALFLLDEQGAGFTTQEQEHVHTAALAMRSALERALLLEYMRRYEQRYTLGQLLGSLVHELSNEIGAIRDNIELLSTILNRLKNVDSNDRTEYRNTAEDLVSDLHGSQESLAVLLDAYSRVARGDFEAVDVNAVIEKTKKSLGKRASECRVAIHLDLEEGLPKVRTIESRLEQVMVNVVLNAIQQIDRQRKLMRNFAKEKDSQTPILQRGQVIIQTRYVEGRKRHPVQISVMDTGPGIHYHQQKSLFQVDISMRETGHGLGLFISRNIMESMGGRLRLVDSIMFIGSLFLLELPLHETEE